MNMNQRCICQICICGNHRCISSAQEAEDKMPSSSPNGSRIGNHSHFIHEGNNVGAEEVKGTRREEGEYVGKYKGTRRLWEKDNLENIHKSLVNLSFEKDDARMNGRHSTSSCSQRSLPPLSNGHLGAVQKMELKSDPKVSRRVTSPPFGIDHNQPVIKDRGTNHQMGGEVAAGQKTRQKTAKENRKKDKAGQIESGAQKMNKESQGAVKESQGVMKEFQLTMKESEAVTSREDRGVIRERAGSEGNNVEWIVMKPQRKKPCDLLKLEGSLDMETTFHSSIDKTAQELLQEYHRKKDGRSTDVQEASFEGVNVAGFNVSTEPPKTSQVGSAPIRKRSSHRPKTSLKLGGPGYYHTVNRDSFKRFVVVDVNNNGSNTSVAVDTTMVKSGSKDGGRRIGAKNVSNDQIIVMDAGDMVFKDELNASDQAAVSLPRLDKVVKRGGRNGSKSDGKNGTKSDGRNGTKSDLRIEGTNKGIREDKRQTERRSKDVQILTIDHGENHQNQYQEQSGHNQESGEKLSGQNHESGKYQQEKGHQEGHKELGHREEHIDRGRRHFMTDDNLNGMNEVTRKRHRSLPRSTNVSKYQHKNESHFKLEGDMEYETTTMAMSNMIQCTNNDHYGLNKSHRDLFKSTNELFTDPRSKFDGSTTYQCQFRDKHYCPAIDLGSKSSEYVYKKHTHGHSFYCKAH